jgi:hypothetical protein
MLDLVTTRWHDEPLPMGDEITRAFWHACRGAQESTAAYLMERRADPNWIG